MLFVYEDIIDGTGYNFINCPDRNKSGFKRFSPSPIAIVIKNYRASKYHNDFVKYFYHVKSTIDNVPYIISTAVNHSPTDWCGYDEKTPETNSYFIDRKPVFEYLTEKYLEDLKNGNAFLLLDQSHEGYQTDWLWSWFHNMSDKYGIRPSKMIYVTGNIKSEEQYKKWADSHNLIDRLCVIGYAHFELVISVTAQNYNKGIVPMPRKYARLPNFATHLRYKTENIDKIKTFNILQKRPRAHRIWLFKRLVENNLIDKQIVSMNYFEQENTYLEGKFLSVEETEPLQKLLPIEPPDNPEKASKGDFESSDCGSYLNHLNESIMLDTWCSVVSEALFDNSTCFLSEKTFKPIANMHPFIIYGNKGSIAELQKLGYKTFHPFIDESYDNLDTWDRIDAIIKEMKRIDSMTPDEKLSWYKGMKSILQHNFITLISNIHLNVLKPVKKVINHVDKNRRD